MEGPRTSGVLRLSNFLLMSLIIHLFLTNLAVFLLKTGSPQQSKDIVEVAMIKTPDSLQRRRKQPKAPLPNRRLITPRQTTSQTRFRPQTIRMDATSHPTSETVSVSPNPLMHDATLAPIDPKSDLPELTRTVSRGNSLLAQPISPLPTTSGSGIESSRQRVRSQRKGGLRTLESTGTSDIGVIGHLPPKVGIGVGETIVGDNPFAKALQKIAQNIVETRETDKVNVVFLLDTSASMRDNIQQVAAHLYAMADTYDTHALEYFLGMVEFSVRHGEKFIRMEPLLADVGLLQNRMQRIELSGDEYALDALLYSLDTIEFHGDAEKHLILVTDEPARTGVNAKSIQTMREKVEMAYGLADVSVNVLGFDEPFQRQLAEKTGGLWQEIPGGTFALGSLPAHRKSNESLVNVFRHISAEIRRTGRLIFQLDFDIPETINLTESDLDHRVITSVTHAFSARGVSLSGSAFFTRVNQNRWKVADSYIGMSLRGSTDGDYRRTMDRTYTIERHNKVLNVFKSSPERTSSEGQADIVLMMDYSRSMGGKSQALSHGITEFYQEMDILPIDYQIGLIRFAVASDAIRIVHGAQILTLDSGAHGPLSEADIEAAMNEPFGGDEHLIDALVDGLSKFKFRPNSARYALIMTDEPTAGTYPAERATQVCRDLGVRTFVIGVSTKSNNFQAQLAIETGGAFFEMPNPFRHLHTDK
jgi:Mg-chelatase subunit ChlD